jgi:hypothetical protein
MMTAARVDVAERLRELAADVADRVASNDTENLDEDEHRVVMDAMTRAEMSLLGCRWLLDRREGEG